MLRPILSRKPFVVTATLAAASVALVALAATGIANAAESKPGDPRDPLVLDPLTSRPNIVLILLDDLDDRVMPFWDAMDDAKRLLYDRGMVFDNAFAPMPICCPARAGLLTGKYGHNTGVRNNTEPHGGWQNFTTEGNVLDGNNEDHTVAKWLDGVGYTTVQIGKYLNGIEADPTHIPRGWDEWYVPVDADHNYYTGVDYSLNENGTVVPYGHSADDYITDVIEDKSIDFMQRTELDDKRPFFMSIAPTAPHQPIGPPDRYKNNQWSDDPAPEKDNFQELILKDKPWWLRSSQGSRRAEISLKNTPDYRNRMGSLLAVDDMIERIVNELETLGETGRTYIFFTSDNGYMMGAHATMGKGYGYEESIGVPQVVVGPNVPHVSDERMALTIDLAPTFAELAHVSIPADVDGRSLVPILKQKPGISWREDFLAEYLAGWDEDERMGGEMTDEEQHQKADDGRSPSHKTVRERKYVYIVWHDAHEIEFVQQEELYDLENDPWQLTNLLATKEGREENAVTRDRLAQRLVELESCSGASCRD